MKIDAKLRDTVPEPELSQVVACSRLSVATGADLSSLLQQLSRVPWERDRIEPRLWVPVLDHFDVLLQAHVRECRYSSSTSTSDAAAEQAVGSVSAELVIQILNFSEQLLHQSEKLRCIYGSLQHVSALLEADHLKLLQAALRLLRLLLKRVRPVDGDLHRRLAPLAAGWAPINPRLTLLQACQGQEELTLEATNDVSFQYRVGSSPQGSPHVECLQVPRAALAASSLDDLVAQAAEEHQLSEASRQELRGRLRTARAMLTPEGRRGLAAIRVSALGAMLLTSASFQKYLSTYPGLLPELVELLRHLPDLDPPVAEAVTAALGILMRERSPHQRQLGLLLQLGQPHGLVCSLLRVALAPPRANGPTCPPATVEAVLQFFLSCVGVGNAGSMGNAAVLGCLLDFTSREGMEWLPAVALAYRAIEGIIDIVSGAATNLFRELNGQGALAQRLSTALSAAAACTQEMPTAATEENATMEVLAASWKSRLNLTLLRGRVGSILRCVVGGLRSEGTRGPGVLRGPLTPLVRNVLSQPLVVGCSSFCAAASIVAHLIGDDPSCVTALIENGVVPAFLDAITASPTILYSHEAFQVVTNVMSAVHLHEAGEREVRDRCNPHPFKVLIKLLLDPVAFRTLGGVSELHSALGGTLDEVAQNRPPMRPTIVGFALSAIQELLESARLYPAWTPQLPGTTPPTTDPTEQYADRLAALGRFLENMLAQGDVATAFAQKGGTARLAEALTMPCLPPLFAQLCPSHNLVLVFRALAPGVEQEPPAEGENEEALRGDVTPKLIGLAKPLSELVSTVLPSRPISELPASESSPLARRLAVVATVLGLHANTNHTVQSLSAVQPRALAAASNAIQELMPIVLWLFEQCAAHGSPPPDPYAEGGAGTNSSTDYAGIVRDAYKETIAKDAGAAEASASAMNDVGELVYPTPAVCEMLWRTLFAVRNFLVVAVGKQLSLPARRPNRLFAPPPTLAPAARSAASSLADLCTQLLTAALPKDAAAGSAEPGTASHNAELLRRLRYLHETMEFIHRAHVDEKHHHVRMLCVDRMFKAGAYGEEGLFREAARFVLNAARTAARCQGEEAVALKEASQQCVADLTQYFERISCFRWIRSAPAPPTSLPVAEREAPTAVVPPAVVLAPPAPDTPGVAAPPPPPAGAAAEAAPEAPPTAAPMEVEAEPPATTPTPPSAAPPTASSQTPAVPPATEQGGSATTEHRSDAIDPWALWASLAASSCGALLPFWTDEDAAVIRLYRPKAVQSILRTFHNTLDNAEGRATDTNTSTSPAAVGRQAANAPQPNLNERAVQALVDMGFPRRRVEVALWNTGSHSIEIAMEWLINHPEPDAPPPGEDGQGERPAEQQAPAQDAPSDPPPGSSEASRTAVAAPALASASVASAADAHASTLATARAALRSGLLSRAAFVGARVGGGTALVELCAKFAQSHLPIMETNGNTAPVGTEASEAAVPMALSPAEAEFPAAPAVSAPTGDGSPAAPSVEPSGAAATGGSPMTAVRLANARAVFDTMLEQLRRTASAFSAEHRVWAPSVGADPESAPASGANDEEQAVNTGLSFALGVIALLLHNRHFVTSLAESTAGTPGSSGGLDELAQLAVVLIRGVAGQRQAALPKTRAEAFEQRYDVVFGNLALPSAQLDRLPLITAPPRWFEAAFVVLHEVAQGMWLAPLPASLAAVMQPAPPILALEVQSTLVNTTLDVLTCYPKIDGNLAMAALLLLREICAVPAGTAALASYSRSGLMLEADGTVTPGDGGGLAALLRLPRSARCPGLLRLVSDVCGQLLADDSFRAQQIEEHLFGLLRQSEAMELRAVVERMQRWVRTCPIVFEEVLKSMCQVRTTKDRSGPEDAPPRVELVLIVEGERKPFRPGRGDSGFPQQQVLHRLLDHLLWIITLERGYEKHAEASSTESNSTPGTAPTSEAASASLNRTSSSPSSASAVPGAAPVAPVSSAAGENAQQQQQQLLPHPLALPADCVLFILQNVLACYPTCTAAFARSSNVSAGASAVCAGLESRGQWAPVASKPPDMPSGGIFLASRSLPVCSASKSPFAFVLKRILANGFFTSDPSPAMIGTLGKVAHVLSTVASKHYETRSKVLHESVSLLKQLANHVEQASGSQSGGTPRRPSSSPGGLSGTESQTRRTSNFVVGGEGAADGSSGVGGGSEDAGGQRTPSPGAFAAGVGVLCDLLAGAVRTGSPQSTSASATPGERPDTPTARLVASAPAPAPAPVPASAPAAPRPGSATSDTTPVSTQGVGGGSSSGSGGGAGTLNATESRTLRSVLCRLLAVVNPYHSDATAVAGHLVRCLELLSRPEVLDSQYGSKPSGGSVSSKAQPSMQSVLPPRFATGPAGGDPDVEMADNEEPGAAATPTNVASADSAASGGRGGSTGLGPDVQAVYNAIHFVDDSILAPRSDGDEVDSDGEHEGGRGGEYGGGARDGEGESDGEGRGMLAHENEDGDGPDDGGMQEDGSEDGDEEFDEEAEEEDGDDGGDDGAEVDEEAAEWDETDGEESEEDGDIHAHHHGHHHHHHGGPDDGVSFIMDFGEGRARILGRGGPGGTIIPGGAVEVGGGDIARSFLQSFGIGIQGLGGPTMGTRQREGGPPTRQSWGWDGDLDLPHAHPLLVASSGQPGGAPPGAPPGAHITLSHGLSLGEGPIPPHALEDPSGFTAAISSGNVRATSRVVESHSSNRWEAAFATHLSQLLPAAPAPPAEPAASWTSASPASAPPGAGGTAAPTDPAAAAEAGAAASPAEAEPPAVAAESEAPATDDGATARDESAMAVEPAAAEALDAMAVDSPAPEASGPTPMEVDDAGAAAPVLAASSDAVPSSVPPAEQPQQQDSVPAISAPAPTQATTESSAETAPVVPPPPPAPAGLDYGVEPLRVLASSIGVAQEAILEAAGVDPQFLEGLPADLREEIVLSQLQNVDIGSIRRQTPPPPSATSAPPTADAPTEPAPAAPRDTPAETPTAAAAADASSAATPAAEAASGGEGASAAAPAAPEGDALAAAPDAGEIAQDVLDALPPDIRREVLEEQARERAAAAAAAARQTQTADASLAQDMDNASFIATLDPALRQEVLLTVTEEVLRTLPPEIVAEANLVRERTFQRTARARAAADQEAAAAPRAPPQAAGSLVLGQDGQWRAIRAPGGGGVGHPGAIAAVIPGPAPGGIGGGGGRGRRVENHTDLIQLLRGHLSGLSFVRGPAQASRRSDGRGHHGRSERAQPPRPDARTVARFDDVGAELPIEPQHTATMCRLVFLRRAVPRALMERLIFNLAVHPTCREAIMRRFLQILVWQVPDGPRSSSSGSGSSSCRLGEGCFPPRHLYGPAALGGGADGTELGVQEACSAPHVAQQVSGSRVLNFLSYLLPRIPQTAEFFAKRLCYREIAHELPDGDEYRRKKKKADRSDSAMEICAEAIGSEPAAINLLIRHTAPDRWPGHASNGHTQLLLMVLRTLLVPSPSSSSTASGVEGASGGAASGAALAASASATSAASGQTARPAAAVATATADAPAAAVAAPAASPADATSAAAPATASGAGAEAAGDATQAQAVPAGVEAWASKLQALLTPESGSALCAHLCSGGAAGGAEPKAAPIVAAVLKGPADDELKACIRSELLRHVKDTVARVESVVASCTDAFGVQLQAAGHEASFLDLLKTLQSLFQEVTASAASSSATDAAGAPSPSAGSASSFQGILADARSDRVWTALDTALTRTVAQWSPEVPEGQSAPAAGLFVGGGGGAASSTAGANASSSAGGATDSPTASKAPPPLLHCLLPLIEAFFLAHAPDKKQPLAAAAPDGTQATIVTPTTPATPAIGSTSSHQDLGRLLAAGEESLQRHDSGRITTPIVTFGERHRKALNALVRQAPSLLSGGFAPLVEQVPWALEFDNKRHYLRQRLRALRGDLRYDVVRLHVRRSEVFMDSFHQLRMRSGEEMRGKLSVTFVGEEAMDAGGVAREWFKILAREIFNPNYALFSPAAGKRGSSTFHPNKTSYVNPDHLDFFKFIGRIIGKALFDGHHLEAYFTRSFYKHMLRRKVSTSDMEALDPDYYRNLRWMQENPIGELLGHLTFTAESDEFGRVRTVELKPGGAAIPVTDENKHEYIQLMCEHKMTKSVAKQINAFLEGFHELVPPHLISIFDDKELELLISGLPEIDLDDLRRNTEYHNYTEATPQVQWFWKVLGEFGKEQKAWFLQFVTGTSQVPLEGFKGLIGMRGPQKFSIHRAEGGDRLPTAHTCFNQLDLPEYSSEDIMRAKLVQAVNEAHEGFGFV